RRGPGLAAAAERRWAQDGGDCPALYLSPARFSGRYAYSPYRPARGAGSAAQLGGADAKANRGDGRAGTVLSVTHYAHSARARDLHSARSALSHLPAAGPLRLLSRSRLLGQTDHERAGGDI